MATHQEVLEQKLSRKELQDLRNKRTGLAIFQASWIMVFVCLILVNLQLRNGFVTWPPEGVGALEPILPTAMTIALIASCFTTRRGVRALRREDTQRFLSNWLVTLGLGALFVLVMAFEWVSIPYSGQFSNMFRLMVGFHGVHALVIAIYMWRVYQNGRNGAYSQTDFWPVEGASGLWYFVAIAWVMFYAVLYIV